MAILSRLSVDRPNRSGPSVLERAATRPVHTVPYIHIHNNFSFIASLLAGSQAINRNRGLIPFVGSVVEEFVSGITAVVTSAALAHRYLNLTAEELLRVCADLRDTAAWDEFIRRFHTTIFAAVLRTGRRYAQFHSALCDDLVQESYLKCSANHAKALREFVPRYPGSAFCYLQVIAMRVTHDYCKKQGFRRMESLPDDQPDISAPDKMEWLVLKAAIEDLLREHAVARDRQIFGLHHLQGMTAREIAAMPDIGLAVKGVESVLTRLRRLIQENFQPR
jgi:RNA polymerase sigma factor (sigma-70 family)